MKTKIMITTEKKIIENMERGVKAGRNIALAIANLFYKWEENDEYKLPVEWLSEEFKFSKQYVYKMESVANRFLSGDLMDEFDGINVSVLMEMLPLNDDKAVELVHHAQDINVQLTQKYVRAAVKKLLVLEKKEDGEDIAIGNDNEENVGNDNEENVDSVSYSEKNVDEILIFLSEYCACDIKEAYNRLDF